MILGRGRRERGPTTANAAANANNLSDPNLVGGDGLEPPTLSV